MSSSLEDNKTMSGHYIKTMFINIRTSTNFDVKKENNFDTNLICMSDIENSNFYSKISFIFSVQRNCESEKLPAVF